MVNTAAAPQDGAVLVDLVRSLDLRKSGQVQGKTPGAISCMCFHPSQPVLCVVVAQEAFSALTLYDVVSGGKLGGVEVRASILTVKFTPDGAQLVFACRDWSIQLLRPTASSWHRSLLLRRKDAKPAENIVIAVARGTKPTVFFAAVGQQRLTVVFGARHASKGKDNKPFEVFKLEKAAIVGLASHPVDPHQVLVQFGDGVVGGYLVEPQGVKRLYYLGDPLNKDVALTHSTLQVVPHPHLPGSILILAASTAWVGMWQGVGRGEARKVDAFALGDLHQLVGLGLDKASGLLLLIGENQGQQLETWAAKVMGGASGGMSLLPVPSQLMRAALDPSLGSLPVAAPTGPTTGTSSLMLDLWDAPPRWTQATQKSMAPPKVHVTEMLIHPVLGSIACRLPPPMVQRVGYQVPLWRAVDGSHPQWGFPAAMLSPLHTSLQFWAGNKRDAEGGYLGLQFPPYMHFCQDSRMMSYGLTTGKVTDFVSFAQAADGHPPTAEFQVHSERQQMWLVFLRQLGQSASDAAESGNQNWRFTLVRENEVSKASSKWSMPGISGAFIGPQDAHIAILSPKLDRVHIYATKGKFPGQAARLNLDVPAMGLRFPAVYPGPPTTRIPHWDSPEGSQNLMDREPTAEEGDVDQDGSYGVILWVTKNQNLVMKRAWGVKISQALSRDMDTASVADTVNMATLGEGEVVVQVAWQRLEDNLSSGYPNSAVCAVLTNRRVMMFMADGSLVASHPGTKSSPAACAPPVSCLWVGPALLFSTIAGQIVQLMWDGSTALICGAPSPTGMVILGGALADRLLLVTRDADMWGWKVIVRWTSMAQPLLMGWATLAASAVVSAPWADSYAIPHLKLVVENFDTSIVAVPLVRTLVRSGFPAIARVIADSWPTQMEKVKVACRVAAGEWEAAKNSLLNEHQRSVYHPGSPPKGSDLWHRLVSTALGAVSQGHWEDAAKLLEAAGEWEQSLAFSAMALDSDHIGGTAAAARENTALSQARKEELFQLSLRLGDACRHSQGPSPLSKLDGAGTFVSKGPKDWSLAAKGSVPSMEAVADGPGAGQVPASDVGTITPLHQDDMRGYVPGADANVRILSAQAIEKQDMDLADDAAFAGSAPDIVPETGPDSDDDRKGAASGAASVAAAFKDQLDDDDFFSSDEEDTDSSVGGPAGSVASSSWSRKFKIEIKGKDAGGTAGGADQLREAAKNLRIGGLGLGPSMAGAGGFQAALKGSLTRQDSMSSVSSSGTSREPHAAAPSGDGMFGDMSSLAPAPGAPGHGIRGIGTSKGGSSDSFPSFATNFGATPAPAAQPVIPKATRPQSISDADFFSGLGLPMGTGTSAAAPSVPSAPPAALGTGVGGSDPLDFFASFAQPAAEDGEALFKKGMEAMESGRWADADEALSKSLTTPASASGPGSAKIVQYLAAVKLMKGRDGAPQSRSARLLRYAAALKIDERHKAALAQSAVTENMQIGNYGYAAGLLDQLITASVGSASTDYMSRLQGQLNECDRKGAGNQDIPNDEDTAIFAEIVGSAGKPEEVENMVQPMVVG
ncbi:unnamed protein product [Ostreobium quekettii]|uniref:Uncharacterized protein n=1 Tax=Ostreobium quekettii TaxID=121088 RepID=A0A8S1IMZ5_9CHLO|nr:unnamed protein product [Ostreobium quekettii]|eukprot:evm.model.scf_106.5 EVM.evm.TU.scf_106.5   scf_106:86170-90942(-)